MLDSASDLAHRLAENAEAVCRRYLSNGRRHGNYWLVGDVHNTPGRSLYVRLHGPTSGRGAAGRWADAASGEHGDLLDLIAARCGTGNTAAALEEARRFFRDAPALPAPPSPALSGSPESARRLFVRGRPIAGTPAATYLSKRGITDLAERSALRFHPHCFYRADPDSPDGARDAWPALLAAVTDGNGTLTGLQRTWLDPSGLRKAPVTTPRRAMGHLLGNAVRFGSAGNVIAVGEGIETVLSLRSALPGMPLAAALSAGHLAAFLPAAPVSRLYIVRDNDPAGHWAATGLIDRMRAIGVEVMVLAPTLGDWNDDLRQFGPAVVADIVRRQLAQEDIARFWRSAP